MDYLKTLIFFIAGLWAIPAFAAPPAWVTSLPLFQWYSIPNTALSSVAPSPPSLGSPTAKIDAWNGATLKRTGSVYMLGAAGGHADYAGNEVDALTLNTATPAWVQLRAPTINSLIYDNPCQFYGDSRPADTHTYYATHFIEARNRMFVIASPGLFGVGGALACPGGWYTGQQRSFSFNMATNDWDSPDYVALYTGGGDFTAAITVKHQTTDDIYLNRWSSGWYKWTQTTNSWSQITSNNDPSGNYACAAMDPTRNRMLVVGDYVGSLAPRVWNTNGTQASVTFTGLGSSALQMSGYPGCVYDEVNDTFLIFYNSGGAVQTRRVNASTWFVDDPSIGGTKPAARPNGLNGSVQYAPELGGIVVANSYTGNVQFMRTSTTQVGSSLVSFTLTSTSTGTKPFTFGQVFKQGDVPAGQVVTTPDATDFQARVMNTWDDGSAKFMILSGRSALTANVAKSHALTVAADPGGTALTEADLTTALTGTGAASIAYGAIGSVSLPALIGATSTLSGGRMTAGRVRTFVSGPKMSSWIYYSRIGSDAHLSAWFEVRLYSSGEVEVLPWVENATLNVASPATKAAATVTFTLGGTSRYSGSITLPHHARAVLSSGSGTSHWLGTNPVVTPKHDVTYMQQSKMVPTYRGVTSAGATVFSRMATTYSPLTAAHIPYSGMEGTGYGIWIGLLNEWEAAYLTSGGDPRAYNAIQLEMYATGAHDIHFRDETTNQPLKFSSYPNLVVGGGENITATGSSTTNTYTPTSSGGGSGGWDEAHHPSLGYMAYLISARFYFLEECQYVATTGFLANSDTNRQTTEGVLRTDVGALQGRGAGWAIRSLAYASAITPTGDPLATEFLNSFGSNINYYHTKYVAQASNPLGVTAAYEDYHGGAAPWGYAPWMDDFITAGWGIAKDVVSGLSGTNQTKLTAFFAWKAKAPIGKLGGTSVSESYFGDAATYNRPMGPNSQANTNFTNGTGPWYANWGGAYGPGCDYGANGCPLSTNPVNANNTLRGGNYPDATSYWGNLQPAISYAVSHGVPGAQAAYDRMIGAANWSSIVTNFNDNPIWSIMPAAVGSIISPPTSTAVSMRRRIQ